MKRTSTYRRLVGCAIVVAALLPAFGVAGGTPLVPSIINSVEEETQTSSSFYVGPGQAVTKTVGTGLSANSLYLFSVGLELSGGDDIQGVHWKVYSIWGDNESAVSQNVYYWVHHPPVWQTLSFVTGPASGQNVNLWVYNWDSQGQWFNYNVVSKRIESNRAIQQIGWEYIERTLDRKSGLRAVWWSPYLSANTMYIFKAAIQAYQTLSGTQVSEVLLRCYRASSEPDQPPVISEATRHSEYYVYQLLIVQVMALTKNSGAYCGLWIDNYENEAMTFAIWINWYSAGTVNRQVHFYGLENNASLGAYQTRSISIASVPSFTKCLVSVYIGLADGDYTQYVNWKIGFGYPPPDDLGYFDRQSIRYWTDYPLSSRSFVVTTVYYTNWLWIYIDNYDSMSQTFKYRAYVYTW